MIEETLVLIKPDAVQRRLVGEIISRFEKKGLALQAMKMLVFDEELVHRHYAEHEGRDYFEPLKKFIMSGPAVAIIVRGTGAIREVRKMAGHTNPLDAEPGTIRGDFGLVTRYNLVHASDSHETAIREIDIFFPDHEPPESMKSE